MNLRITFEYAWVYLLLIPAFAIALWPYFRLDRKYRRNRNRIISLVLHLCIIFFCVNVLSGVAFAYDEGITENELIIVVDVSYSSKNTQDEKNAFIEEILKNKTDSFKVGIVTFGLEPDYVAPLSHNADEVFSQYKSSLSSKPNFDAGTNITKALFEATSHFADTRAAKIILLSDGIEIDTINDQGEDISAISAITSISNRGVVIDTVHFGNDYGNEIQIVSVETPNYNVKAERNVSINMLVYSVIEAPVSIGIYDNSTDGVFTTKFLEEGINKISVDHVFKQLGTHKMRFTVAPLDETADNNEFNNEYYTYVNLKNFDRLLIVTAGDEAGRIENLIVNDPQYLNLSKDASGNHNYKIVNIYNEAPKTLEELTEFDQVMMVNIANSQMPNGFVEMLDTYVRVLGGGMLTIGGENNDGENNIYSKNEMYNAFGVPTLYQEMLPVECDEYYPPVAVMLALDTSGSMETPLDSDGNRPIDTAKDAVVKIASEDYLHARDYLGVVSFSTGATIELELEQLPPYNRIKNKLAPIPASGGTSWTAAVSMSLKGFTSNNLARKHIVLVTDGEPWPSLNAEWGTLVPKLQECVEKRITLSIIAIGGGATVGAANETINKFNDLWEERYGEPAEVSGIVSHVPNIGNLKNALQGLFGSKGIKPTEGKFIPTIGDYTSILSEVDIHNLPEINGLYGVKKRDKEGVVAPLMGEFTPLYAQWNYGRGKVGSLMVDLNGKWSGQLLTTNNGKQIVENIVNGLFPSNSIVQPEIETTISRINDHFKVVVDSKFAASEGFEVTITDITDSAAGKTYTPGFAYESGKAVAVAKVDRTGIYQISIYKIRRSTNERISGEHLVFTTYSYSDEYDVLTTKNGELLLQQMAKNNEQGRYIERLFETAPSGTKVDLTDYEGVYKGMPETKEESFTPRIILIILVLIMFLLDLAVRKFKFRWPWEIYRDSKAKQELAKTQAKR